MGKCAYTKRILYSNLEVTPSKRLRMWLHTLRNMESCLLFAKYILALTVWPLLTRSNSMGMCLKSRSSFPCLPSTTTFFDLMEILMPLGTTRVSSCTKVFIAIGEDGSGCTNPHTL